jgi:hypothetical protein
MLAAGGALLGFSASLAIPHRYVARTTLALKQTPGLGARRLYDDASHQTLTQESLGPMILQSAYFRPKLDSIPVEDLVREIQENSVMTASSLPGGGDGFTIEFSGDDRYAAYETATVLIARLNENAVRLRSAGTPADLMRVVEPLHVEPAGPNPALLTGIGLVAGLLAAALLWWGAARAA